MKMLWLLPLLMLLLLPTQPDTVSISRRRQKVFDLISSAMASHSS
jgi:hypothetical protein